MSRNRKKRILAVVGSPRKGGNSDSLCDAVLAGAAGAGALAEKVYLHDCDIRPCRACGWCLKGRPLRCAMDDGMVPLYPKLASCDALVVASPIYFLNLSAQTVLFLNRTYPLFNPGGCAIGAKRAVACLAYGDADPIGSGADIAARVLRELFQFAGIPLALVHASALEKGAVRANKAIMERARQLGKEAVELPSSPR